MTPSKPTPGQMARRTREVKRARAEAVARERRDAARAAARAGRGRRPLPPPTLPPSLGRRVWRKLRRLALLGALGFVLLATALAALLYVFTAIPDPAGQATAQSATVVDRNGVVIGRIHAEADRVSLPLERIPQHVRDAVVAAEDRRFYRHSGISIPAVVRATMANVINRGVEQGGSTITQQYVKNAFVGNERSYWRKAKEAVLALKLERRLSKDEILERYLNTIYFGRGTYGVEAASRAYFGAGVARLNLPQAALLAGIIRSPENLDPAREPKAARARRDFVLDAMAGMGAIEREDAEAASATPVRVRPRRADGGFAAYVLEDVRRELERRLGGGRIYVGGLRIRTTIDIEMQRAAEDAVSSILDRPSDPDAALVSLDPASGEVRAMVGGRDFERLQFNLATQGRRQPGSAFKPFVLAAALENGRTLTTRVRAPARATFATKPKPWPVRNYDDRDYGRPTLLEATRSSVNTAYARLILDVGPDKVAELAGRAGIPGKIPPIPSLALGAAPVSPLDLAAAYATFANGGRVAGPHMIARVADGNGRSLYDAETPVFPAVKPDVAANVTAALRDAVERGTGRRARLARPTAGKTGTTQNHMDAWFAGYTPDLVTVVWMGYAGGERTMENVRGIKVTGGSFPARIWRAFMTEALSGAPARDFPPAPAPSPTRSPSPRSSSPSPAPSGSSPQAPAPGPVPPAPTPSLGSPTPSPSPSPTASPKPSG